MTWRDHYRGIIGGIVAAGSGRSSSEFPGRPSGTGPKKCIVMKYAGNSPGKPGSARAATFIARRRRATQSV